uniref:Secreted protein n=1 Tax=Steinernema glaseri TaxID=37863 RepID=A0A1I7Y738_9BILA
MGPQAGWYWIEITFEFVRSVANRLSLARATDRFVASLPSRNAKGSVATKRTCSRSSHINAGNWRASFINSKQHPIWAICSKHNKCFGAPSICFVKHKTNAKFKVIFLLTMVSDNFFRWNKVDCDLQHFFNCKKSRH